TPSTFARLLLTTGVGAVWHNLIFDLGSDIGFVWSDGTLRTLQTTQRFGDYVQGSLSRVIDTLIGDRLNATQLKRGWADTDPQRGYPLITLPFDSSAVPNLTIMMDTRFGDPRFATWTALQAWSVARMSDPGNSDRQILFLGGNDGYVRKTQQTTRAVDTSTAIAAYARMPFLHYGSPKQAKTAQHIGIGLAPKGDFAIDISLRREDLASQTSVVQGGAAVLSPASIDVFTLDSSTLAGDQYRKLWTG